MPSAPAGVVDALKSSLALHWAAVEVYAAQSEHFTRWGFPKLGEEFAADAEEERGHANKLLARLEYYNAAPTADHPFLDWPRDNYPGVLDANYAMETAAANVERAGYTTALAAADPLTASIFLDLIEGSEGSIRDIEATKNVIAAVGLDNFLASKI